jgi:hypothetical protein
MRPLDLSAVPVEWTSGAVGAVRSAPCVRAVGAASGAAGRCISIVIQGYSGEVGSLYRLTLPGVENALEHGVTPRELWRVLESDGRLFVPVGARSRFVVGQLESSRWIGFLAQEVDGEDDVWEIVAARELDEREVDQVRRLAQDRPGVTDTRRPPCVTPRSTYTAPT